MVIAKALPIINAVFVQHTLTHGKDTMPSRRAIQSNKVSHDKRGWREVNAKGLVNEYVVGINYYPYFHLLLWVEESM